MRPDFNKLLTERERIGHQNSHHGHRHLKKFNIIDDEGPVGGREGMKAR